MIVMLLFSFKVLFVHTISNRLCHIILKSNCIRIMHAKFICNFNFRNPNGNSSGLWTPYTLKGREFINLDLNITMASSLYKDRVHFWLTTVPNLVQGCQSNSVNSAPTDVLNILLVIVVLLTPLCIFC